MVKRLSARAELIGILAEAIAVEKLWERRQFLSGLRPLTAFNSLRVEKSLKRKVGKVRKETTAKSRSTEGTELHKGTPQR